MNLSPIVAVILGVILAGGGLIARAVWLANDQQARTTRQHVETILDHLSLELGVSAKDYAWWDEAFQELHVKGSSEWAQDNFTEGTVIGAERSVDGVMVLDRNNVLIHGLWLGTVLEPAALTGFSGGLIQLVDAARSAAGDEPIAVTGILARDGEFALAAALAVLPMDTELLAGAPSGASVVVFLRTLSPDYLAKVGALFDLPEARASVNVPAGESRVLTGIDGAVLGHLAWVPSKPGSNLLESIWLETLIVVVLLSTFGGVVLVQLLAQRRTMRAQVRLIDEGAARLNETIAVLSNTLQAIDDGIAMYDRDARLKHWNKSYERLCSLPAGFAWTGMSVKEILDHTIKVAGFELQECDEFGQPATDPYRLERTGRWVYRRGDGRIVAVRRLPLTDGGYLSISSDMTQQKQHEQELVGAREEAIVANRSKSEFLANVSHELRTPLNAIIGFSEIMGRELFGSLGSDRYKSYVADIHNSGEHLLSLINDILDLSKIESGRFELRLESLDCVELAQNAARLIRPRSQENQQELVLDLPSAPLSLIADKRALKQVLINLLSNAVKFTPEGGRVTLACRSVQGGVEFAVTDTGIGIDEKDIELALSPFGQIDSHYARRHEGTGLGLPIVRGIVALHDGKLKLDSRVGAGTMVTFFLPNQGMGSSATALPADPEFMSRILAP